MDALDAGLQAVSTVHALPSLEEAIVQRQRACRRTVNSFVESARQALMPTAYLYIGKNGPLQPAIEQIIASIVRKGDSTKSPNLAKQQLQYCDELLTLQAARSRVSNALAWADQIERILEVTKFAQKVELMLMATMDATIRRQLILECLLIHLSISDAYIPYGIRSLKNGKFVPMRKNMSERDFHKFVATHITPQDTGCMRQAVATVEVLRSKLAADEMYKIAEFLGMHDRMHALELDVKRIHGAVPDFRASVATYLESVCQGLDGSGALVHLRRRSLSADDSISCVNRLTRVAKRPIAEEKKSSTSENVIRGNTLLVCDTRTSQFLRRHGKTHNLRVSHLRNHGGTENSIVDCALHADVVCVNANNINISKRVEFENIVYFYPHTGFVLSRDHLPRAASRWIILDAASVRLQWQMSHSLPDMSSGHKSVPTDRLHTLLHVL